MTVCFLKLTTPFLCTLLLGVLSSCGSSLGFVAASAIPYGPVQPDPEPWRTGKNFYEPVVLTSSENQIKIKYLSVGPNAEHEQVKQLMSEHCRGAYVETSRVELRGYDTIAAECTSSTESLQ